jgi:hypothetical protein
MLSDAERGKLELWIEKLTRRIANAPSLKLPDGRDWQRRVEHTRGLFGVAGHVWVADTAERN